MSATNNSNGTSICVLFVAVDILAPLNLQRTNLSLTKIPLSGMKFTPISKKGKFCKRLPGAKATILLNSTEVMVIVAVRSTCPKPTETGR